jgi:hypothetical protein
VRDGDWFVIARGQPERGYAWTAAENDHVEQVASAGAGDRCPRRRHADDHVRGDATGLTTSSSTTRGRSSLTSPPKPRASRSPSAERTDRMPVNSRAARTWPDLGTGVRPAGPATSDRPGRSTSTTTSAARPRTRRRRAARRREPRGGLRLDAAAGAIPRRARRRRRRSRAGCVPPGHAHQRGPEARRQVSAAQPRAP